MDRILDMKVTVARPLSLAAFAIIVFIISISIPAIRLRRTMDRVLVLLPVPVLLGLVFWFFSAPDPRFASALFFLLPAACGYPLLRLLVTEWQRYPIAGILIAALVIGYPINSWLFKHASDVLKLPASSYPVINTTPLMTQRTASGLAVLVPLQGDQCWDAPLPCTPYFDEKLRLRGEDIRQGFSVQ